MTLAWLAVILVVFPVLVLLGVLMRFVQANYLQVAPGTFYSLMTAHGLGMVGLFFAGGMAGVSHLLGRYVSPSPGVARLAFAATLTGVVLLIVSTLLGGFAAGWYFLYPLPLSPAAGWPAWSAAVFLLAIAVLGVGWLIWTLDLLRAIVQRYSLRGALAWHYLAGRSGPELPPLVLITTVSLVVAVVSLLSGVAVLALFVAAWLTGTADQALLVKNLTFLFGHLLVNLTMYLGVATAYEVLPAYADRPWKTNRIVATAWNAVLLLVLAAYFHHLYMDFVQPTWFQFTGQIASYVSSVPAAVVSIFGTLTLVYRAKMRWNLASLLLYVGVMGWAIGGLAAVIDSTIVVNVRFHNTLWVPAHFHTYTLMGVVPMLLGFAYHFTQAQAKLPESPQRAKLVAGLLLVGGYGFLLMFYVAGADSIPRRYAVYPAELAQGAVYAAISLVFLAVLALGAVAYLWEVGRSWLRAAPSS